MNLQNVFSVASKDFETYKRKKSIVGYTLGLPLIMATAFSFIVQSQIATTAQGGVNPPGQLNLGMLSLTYLFVVFGAILPTSIAAYSIVGEKVEKSLEPMLATPLTESEILLGKTVAALVPSILTTWLGASIFMAASDSVLLGPIGYYYFPNWTAGIVLFLLLPLAELLGVEVAVIASSRIGDVRGANQLGGLIWLPFMTVFIAGVEGAFDFTAENFVIFAGILAAIEVGLFFVSTSTFNREQILTRWK